MLPRSLLGCALLLLLLSSEAIAAEQKVRFRRVDVAARDSLSHGRKTLTKHRRLHSHSTRIIGDDRCHSWAGFTLAKSMDVNPEVAQRPHQRRWCLHGRYIRGDIVERLSTSTKTRIEQMLNACDRAWNAFSTANRSFLRGVKEKSSLTDAIGKQCQKMLPLLVVPITQRNIAPSDAEFTQARAVLREMWVMVGTAFSRQSANYQAEAAQWGKIVAANQAAHNTMKLLIGEFLGALKESKLPAVSQAAAMLDIVYSSVCVVVDGMVEGKDAEDIAIDLLLEELSKLISVGSIGAESTHAAQTTKEKVKQFLVGHKEAFLEAFAEGEKSCRKQKAAPFSDKCMQARRQAYLQIFVKTILGDALKMVNSQITKEVAGQKLSKFDTELRANLPAVVVFMYMVPFKLFTTSLENAQQEKKAQGGHG